MDLTVGQTPTASFDLMKLPQEVVLRVIQLVHPNDLENTFLTCKTVFELAKQVRERHREKTMKYRTVILGNVSFVTCQYGYDLNDKNNNAHPAFALRDLLQDRETMSDYCHTLRVGGLDADAQLRNKFDSYDDDNDNDRDGSNDDNKYSSSVLDEASAIIAESTLKLSELADTEPTFRSLHHLNMTSQSQGLVDGNYRLPCFMMFDFLKQIQVLELVGLGDLFDNDVIKTWDLLLETDTDTTF
ncbi:MAG: hypothetical protein Q9226_006886 [Calogaya cf. arnoldii]